MNMLCLDVGNTNIYGGVFQNEKIALRFRYATKNQSTSDEIGLFLKNVLRENKINPEEIQAISICSVVPAIDYSLRAACIKYFVREPFILQIGVKTGLKIVCHTPNEVGADRVATAIAAINTYPNHDIIVVDLGTASTICAITKNKEYLSGVIMPGMKIAMESLQNNTAKLAAVEISKPPCVIGRTTAENIQSGLYYSQLGAIREITKLIINETFAGRKPKIIGTGGFAYLFQDSQIFDTIESDLVLHGLRAAWLLNSY